MLRLYLLLFISSNLFAQINASKWADSIMSRMSADDKIRQLFIIPASPDQINPLTGVIDRIQEVRPGGIFLTSGGPISNARMISKLQSSSPIPLIVAIQAEWGIGQTIDSIKSLPFPAILGATSDSLAKIAGIITARQMKMIGAHMNIGLNADVDVPNDHSTISYRYFSDNPEILTNRISAYIDGLQQNGKLAVIRHLPGKELLKEDSYYGSATSLNSDSLSFLPFIQLIKKNASGINTAYLHYSLRQKNRLSPLIHSKTFIPDILKKRFGYQGLVISEIPFVKNFSTRGKGDAEKLAFETGHDLLIEPLNPDAAIRKIKRLLRRDPKYLKQLNESVKKILITKFQAIKSEKLNPAGVIDQGTQLLTDILNFTSHAQAVTVIKNDRSVLPVRELDKRNFYLINAGKYTEKLKDGFDRYAPFRSGTLSNLEDTVKFRKYAPSDLIVIALNDKSPALSSLKNWLLSLSAKAEVIIIHSGSPYDLDLLSDLPTIIELYHESGTEEMVSQVIFGALGSTGKLPFHLNLISSSGISVEPISRLGYSIPEISGMSSYILGEIDEIAEEAISSGATPGCRVVIARKGKIIFNRAYGWLTYDRKIPVTDETIYDLASVTKVTATLQAIMHLYDRDEIDLLKKISVYLPELKLSNKKDFILKDILTHQAGLWPYLPFWTRTMTNKELMPFYYAKEKSTDFPFDVSEGLFAHRSMRDSLRKWIIDARIIDKKDRRPFDYRYSDMGFYMLQYLSETMLDKPLEVFLDEFLFRPMGTYTTGFLPLNKFSSKRIAPTEDDQGFRKSLLVGYVHDQGAAMHGGVAGHAGLFSDANDLAKLGQMWLQKGFYGGHQFFRPSTIDLFTSRQYKESRRGLGWDKPWFDDSSSNPAGSFASPETFGHTGFTGTCVWVDPSFDLVYVFLSNRVHPDMNNSKLITGNIRTRIHDVAYKAINAFQAINP